MKLSYLQQGFGSRLPLVLLHPYPLNARFWSNQLSGLSKDRHVIAPNFRGYGSSSADGPDEFTVERFASDVRKTLHTAQIPKAIFAGCSMGGYVLFELWRQAPELIDSMILADTKADADTDAAKARRLETIENVKKVGTVELPDTVAGFLSDATKTNCPSVEREVRMWASEAKAETVTKSLQMLVNRPDSTPTLSTINVPTLILVGEEDKITPPDDARKMETIIADASMVVVPNAGHLSPLENPRVVNEAITEFLAETEPAIS